MTAATKLKPCPKHGPQFWPWDKVSQFNGSRTYACPLCAREKADADRRASEQYFIDEWNDRRAAANGRDDG